MAALAFARTSFTQELDGKSNLVPDNVGFDRPLSPGLDLRGVYRRSADDPLGFAGSVRFYKSAIDLMDETQDLLGWTAALGARYRGTLPSAGIGWVAIADLHRVGLPVIQYENKNQKTAEITTLSLWGVRLGAGLLAEIDPVTVELSLAQTLALAPVDTHVGLAAVYPIQPNLSARLGMDLDMMGGTVEVDDTEIDVGYRETVLTLGVTYVP
jgi:hypothetical protein